MNKRARAVDSCVYARQNIPLTGSNIDELPVDGMGGIGRAEQGGAANTGLQPSTDAGAEIMYAIK